MKLSEIMTTEHERAPMERDVSVEQQKEWLAQATRTSLVTAAPGEEALSIFKLELNSANHVFIFTKRTKQDDPVGYCILSKDGSYWNVISIWLKPELRRKGYSANLYRALTAGDYKLKSGKVLSSEAEQLWLSLGKAGVAKVLDTKTGEVLPFGNQPIGDGDIRQGLSPRYYWITENESICLYFDRGSGTPEDIQAFIEGTPKGATIGSLGISCFIIEAKV